MARPIKMTVDYFPHDCTHGKTVFILQRKFGNDGYAVFFKILELLGRTENHYYDCRCLPSWEYFLAEMDVGGGRASDILQSLADLGAIDKEMWSEKVIYCDKFVDRIEDVYKKRENSFCLRKPGLCEYLRLKCARKPSSKGVSGVENTQTKLKETKLNKILHGEFVFLTKEEHEKLTQEYGGPQAERMITTLDNYKGSSGKKYKSDYRAILSWVADRVKNEKGGTSERDKNFLGSVAEDC